MIDDAISRSYYLFFQEATVSIRLLYIILFACLSIQSLCTVQAQQIPTTNQFISIANNEINNFYGEAPNYWFNVSQTIIFQSFSDIAQARTDIIVAGALLSQNDSAALAVAANAAFEGRRANYRLLVYMASRLLEKAGNVIDGIPSYIAKPTDIIQTYQNAVALCQAQNLTQVFASFPSTLQQEWELIKQMDSSGERLWWADDSVRSLSNLVIGETGPYVAKQIRIHNEQIRNSYLYSTGPTSVVLVVFLAAIILDLGMPALCWLKRLPVAMKSLENRQVRVRRRSSMLLMAPGITLVLALAYIPATISQLPTVESSFPWPIAYPAVFVAVTALCMNIYNLFRPRILWVALCVLLEIAAIALYLILAVEIWLVVF
jgi:hypothetical protein